MLSNQKKIRYPILLIGNKHEPIEYRCPECKNHITRKQGICGCGTAITWDVAEQLLQFKMLA